VAHDLAADLDQPVPERRHRPVPHGVGQGQGSQKAPEVVGERVQLQANGVVGELMTGYRVLSIGGVVVSKQLALVKRLVADAVNGKASAQRTVFELIERSSNLEPDQTHTQDLKPEEQEVLDVLFKRGRETETSSGTDDGDEE